MGKTDELSNPSVSPHSDPKPKINHLKLISHTLQAVPQAGDPNTSNAFLFPFQSSAAAWWHLRHNNNKGRLCARWTNDPAFLQAEDPHAVRKLDLITSISCSNLVFQGETWLVSEKWSLVIKLIYFNEGTTLQNDTERSYARLLRTTLSYLNKLWILTECKDLHISQSHLSVHSEHDKCLN